MHRDDVGAEARFLLFADGMSWYLLYDDDDNVTYNDYTLGR